MACCGTRNGIYTGLLSVLCGLRSCPAYGAETPLASATRGTISVYMEDEIKAPKLTGTAKLDATTDAAYAIIDERDLSREAKTLRLRKLRLEKEAAERAARAVDTPKQKKSKRVDLLS